QPPHGLSHGHAALRREPDGVLRRVPRAPEPQPHRRARRAGAVADRAERRGQDDAVRRPHGPRDAVGRPGPVQGHRQRARDEPARDRQRRGQSEVPAAVGLPGAHGLREHAPVGGSEALHLHARRGPGLPRARRDRRGARPGRTARARRRPGGHALARRAAVARDRDAARPGAEAPLARRAGGGDDAAGEGAYRRAHRGDRGALDLRRHAHRARHGVRSADRATGPPRDGAARRHRALGRLARPRAGRRACDQGVPRAREGAGDRLMLAVNGIDVYYGESRILSHVGLSVGDGQVVCVMGRNGVGKTTLLKTIVGLLAPRAGAIEFRGRDITRRPPYERARLGIGYVPQGRAGTAGGGGAWTGGGAGGGGGGAGWRGAGRRAAGGLAGGGGGGGPGGGGGGGWVGAGGGGWGAAAQAGVATGVVGPAGGS